MSSEARQTGARDALRFRFRGGDVELRQFSPRATVLDWLREDTGAKGTKEGCAEGDCGACTVVLARLSGRRLTYEPFNACILLLGQIDGAELITIEDLAEGGDTASGAAGDGRFPRLAMRLLHARDRDEPVCAYHSGEPATYAGLCERLRAISAAAPAIGRSSMRRCETATASRPTISPRRRRSALRRSTPSPTAETCSSASEAAFFAAPASLDALAALYARYPDATSSAGRPTSGSGSPSNCAT